MNATRNYLEDFRGLDSEQAALESEPVYTRDRIEALDLPAVARYAFQVYAGRSNFPTKVSEH